MTGQKTILITVGTAFVAKNILRSDVLKTLLGRSEIKIVAVVPEGAEEFFNDLAGEKAIIEAVGIPKQGFLRKSFLWLAHNLIFTSTTYVLYGGTVNGRPKRLSVFFRKLTSKTFGRFDFIKRKMEKLDLFFFRKRPYQKIFDRHNPSLIFATNLLNDALDGGVLKEAKRRKIYTVGMPKSWDSFNKRFVHLKSDILLVWNEIVKKEAVFLQGYEKERVFVVGMPQNDDYVRRKGVVPKQVFLKSLSFAKNRPLILFGSGGEYTPEDNEILGVLAEAVEKGEIDANILVRPYCGTPNAQRYGKFNGLPFLKIDSCPDKKPKGGIKEKNIGKKWAFFDEVHFMNSLAHADVLVTFASTLAVDASFFDLPTVLVGFDLKPKPWLKSLRRYYDTKHYRNIVETGGVRLALSKEKFIEYINNYLRDPDLDAEKRLILKSRIGGPADGHVGEKIGNLILETLAF
jgi:hypothetical protein